MLDRTAKRFGLKPRHFGADSCLWLGGEPGLAGQTAPDRPTYPGVNKSSRTHGTFSRFRPRLRPGAQPLHLFGVQVAGGVPADLRDAALGHGRDRSCRSSDRTIAPWPAFRSNHHFVWPWQPDWRFDRLAGVAAVREEPFAGADGAFSHTLRLLALIILYVLAIWTGWFPLGGAYPTLPATVDLRVIADVAYHAFLPALSIVLAGIGFRACMDRSGLGIVELYDAVVAYGTRPRTMVQAHSHCTRSTCWRRFGGKQAARFPPLGLFANDVPNADQ